MEMKRLTTSVTVVLLCPIVLAGSLYECYPIEPEPGEMVVCPMEGLESPFSGEFGWIIHEPRMGWDQPRIVWDLGEAKGELSERAVASFGEFTERLLDELREEFGKIESGEVEIEENEFVKRLIDEFREETGIEIEKIEIEYD